VGSFFNNFKRIFSSPTASSNNNFVSINVKCQRCSEEINVKLRKTSDISRLYEEDNPPSSAAYFVRKEVLGEKCNNLIYITIYFDENFNIAYKEIKGGEFL